MRKVLAATAVIAGLAVSATGAAWAVDYPATTGSLSVTSLSASQIQISGCGFAPGATVQLQVNAASAGTTNASATGCITATVNAVSGDTVTATGLNTGGGTLTLRATVGSSTAGSSTGSFAFTGANTGVLVAAALVLLLVGTLFVVVTRRRVGADRP